MCAGRAIWWVFTRLSRCGYQSLWAVCGSNLAEVYPSLYIVSALVPPGMADVDCALCRLVNLINEHYYYYYYRRETARRSVSVEMLFYCCTNNANRSPVSLRSTFSNCHVTELQNYNQTSSSSHSLPTRGTRLITHSLECDDDVVYMHRLSEKRQNALLHAVL